LLTPAPATITQVDISFHLSSYDSYFANVPPFEQTILIAPLDDGDGGNVGIIIEILMPLRLGW
jgi:hypothetical protein